MQTLKPQSPEFHTLREDLDLRPTHRLTEEEVKEFLLQVLPQMEWLHSQGQTHGSISLDTLAFYEGQIRLLEGNSASQNFPDPSHDIADLGQVVLQMLTSKPTVDLRDSYGNWNWEEECLVTDHLADIINQMIGNTEELPLGSAQQVLAMLKNQQQSLSQIRSSHQSTMGISSETPSFYAHPPTNSVNSYSAKSIADVGNQQDTKKPKFKPKLWQWATLGILFGIGLLSAVTLPVFFNQATKARQSEAITYLGSIALAQRRNFEENDSFINSWNELGLGINPNQESYKYNMYKLNDAQVIVNASAKDKELLSYSAIIFLSQDSDGKVVPNSTICQTIEPSKVPPQSIQLLETAVVCPQGSEIKSTFFSGGKNLLELPSQVSASDHRNDFQSNTPSTRSLTQDEAVEIVSRWLSAKPRIFGPPFDKNLLEQLATGSTYQDNLGSIDWLQGNGYRYSYSASRIQNVWSFVTSNTTPSIKVSIYEDLTLHSPRGIDRSKSGASTRNFTYYFARDVDGQWKISGYRRSE
jgi:type II secretory pathway pseudopilin PulG